MPIFTVELTWPYSVEILELDTTTLPDVESFFDTTEHRDGGTTTYSYRAQVMSLSDSEASLSLELQYRAKENQAIPNKWWGMLSLTLSKAEGNHDNSAVWRDDKGENYSGNAIMRVMQRPTTDEAIADELNSDFTDIMGEARETDKLTQILARIGQGAFRRNVARAWNMGEKCAVTQIDIPEMLIASHIRPWRVSAAAQRIDPANGLLLAAHVDKLFDRDLLSFRETNAGWMLVLHPRVRHAAKSAGIVAGTKLPVERLDTALRIRFAEYMREHYERFEKNIAAHNSDLW